MKLLLIADKKGRIQYNRLKILERYLPNEYQSDVLTLDDTRSVNPAQVVYYSHFSLYDKLKIKGQRTITSVTSHKCLDNLNDTLKKLNNFHAISVNNTFLYESLSPYISELYYTPNGVDTKTFSFKEHEMSQPLRLGWAGNKDRGTKNFQTIFEPLKKEIDAEFDIVATTKGTPSHDMKNTNQMVQFYQSLDYLLVTSSTEGTPNPALEAMACGTPVIATNVGNIPDIVEDGVNGFIVKDNVDSFKKAIEDARHVEDYVSMRQHIRKVMKSWDWDYKHQNWINFFTYD